MSLPKLCFAALLFLAAPLQGQETLYEPQHYSRPVTTGALKPTEIPEHNMRVALAEALHSMSEYHASHGKFIPPTELQDMGLLHIPDSNVVFSVYMSANPRMAYTLKVKYRGSPLQCRTDYRVGQKFSEISCSIPEWARLRLRGLFMASMKSVG